MRPSLALLLLPLAACTTNLVQRTARVPHAAAPLHDGQPMEGPIALSAGLDNAVDLKKPAVGNKQSSVETPTLEMRDEFRIRAFDRGEFALVYERGLGQYQRLDPTQAPVEEGDPAGYGIAFRYSWVLDPHWSLGTSVELLAWSIPYVEWSTCVDNCFGQPYTIESHQTDSAATIGVGVTPSYRSGNLTLFGGVFARNHPTVQRKTIEAGIDNPSPVENGPLNAVFHVGASYRFGDSGVAALAQITQDVVADPVQYYPGIGLALQVELGTKQQPRAHDALYPPAPAPVPSGPPGAQ